MAVDAYTLFDGAQPGSPSPSLSDDTPIAASTADIDFGDDIDALPPTQQVEPPKRRKQAAPQRHPGLPTATPIANRAASSTADKTTVSSSSTTTTVQRTEVLVVKPKIKRRWRPGTCALREIRKQQQSTAACIPCAPLIRLIREIVADVAIHEGIRFTQKALEAIQEDCEGFLVRLFEESQIMAFHAGRVTVMPEDMILAFRALAPSYRVDIQAWLRERNPVLLVPVNKRRRRYRSA